MAALTFNFRGVGASEGVHDGGKGERDDVRAALDAARSMPGVMRVSLAGYSFGAGMAAAVADSSIEALCLVSAPARMLGPDSGFRSFVGPVLLVSGDADSVSSIDALREASKAASGAIEVTVVPGADHFWWGKEAALSEAVKRFFDSLTQPRA